MALKARRRCVCGRSKTAPLCDGAHASEAWSCAQPSREVELLVASSPALVNFAERLAHSLGGQAAHKSDQLSAQRVLRLADAQVPRPAPYLSASRALTIVIDAPLSLVVPLIPEGESALGLEEEGLEPAQLWRAIKARAEDPASWEPAPRWELNEPRPALFLSHAIADERLLLPVVQRLREGYGLQVFVCVDSLEAGGHWRDELHEALESSSLVIIALSEALARSTFCAYEVGVAHGRGIPTLALSLDGVTPPLYLSHLQTVDVPRQQVIKPWLSQEELLLQLTLSLIDRILS